MQVVLVLVQRGVSACRSGKAFPVKKLALAVCAFVLLFTVFDPVLFGASTATKRHFLCSNLSFPRKPCSIRLAKLFQPEFCPLLHIPLRDHPQTQGKGEFVRQKALAELFQFSEIVSFVV